MFSTPLVELKKYIIYFTYFAFTLLIAANIKGTLFTAIKVLIE